MTQGLVMLAVRWQCVSMQELQQACLPLAVSPLCCTAGSPNRCVVQQQATQYQLIR